VYDFTIYICSYGDTKDATALSLEQLHQHTNYRFDVRWVTGDALIGRSRSRAASHFLWCDDSPYMIFVDGDIVFLPDDITKIYRSMEAGYDIVAGAYSVGDGTFLAIHCTDPVSLDGKIHEAKYVSTGFMGISRKALKTIKNDLQLPLLHKGEWCECWPFFESGALPEEKKYLSEDWDFCRKAQKCGIKSWFHTGVLVGHFKGRIVTAQEAVANMNKGHTPAQTISADCVVYSTLAQDLKDFTGKTSDELSVKLSTAPSDIADVFKASGQKLEEFYATGGDHHIMDLVAFNLDPMYWPDRVMPLSTTRDTTILDVGCGIGTLSLYLASMRNRVIGYDINPTTLDFAKFRAKKFGFSNLFFTDQWPKGPFDLVCAVDVLEHIPDLGEMLKRIGDVLKPGGKLYHVDSFYHKHPISLHLDCTDEQFSEYLEEAGLIRFDDRWAIRK
jgi:SAM-dependent methyltransferase